LARTYYEESLRVARELDQKALMAIALHNLGYVALHEKAYEQARSYFGQSLSFSREVGNEFVTMLCVGALAGVLGASGESLLAARLLGAMLAQVELRDQKLEPCDQLEIDRAVAAVQAQLDETTFTTAWAEGRGMSLEQAVGVAMEG
jgi:tetratricopeptide (TPR) repeat protein